MSISAFSLAGRALLLCCFPEVVDAGNDIAPSMEQMLVAGARSESSVTELLYQIGVPDKVLDQQQGQVPRNLSMQRHELPLEQMLVTAARSEASVTALPYQIDVLDQQQLQRQLPRNLPEALVNVPGVVVQKTANGQGSPFIRGFTGYRTLALIDGVRYNNSVYRDGPSEYFSLIDSQSLQQIELLRGPASTLYGSDAIGGALNLHSQSSSYLDRRDGQSYVAGALWSRYASAEDSLIGRAEIDTGVGGGWGLKGGYSGKDFGDVDAADLGVQAKTGYSESAWDLRFDKVLSDQWDLTYLHQSLEQDDVWRTHSTIYAISFAGTEVGSDLRRLKDQQRQLDYLKLRGEDISSAVDNLQITVSRQHWREEGERVKGGGKGIEDWFDSSMWGLDLQLQSQFDSLSLTYGFDYYLDKVDTGRIDYNSDGSVDRVRIQGPVGDDSEFAQGGIYLQANVDLSERWLLSLGSRYNTVAADVRRFEDPATGQPASYRDDCNSWVSSVRSSFDLSDRWILWGGISQSFRAPNIADISRYGGSRSNELEIAATELEPEEFLTGEIGVKLQGDRLAGSASIFYTDMDDYIASTPTGRILQDDQIEVSKQNAASGYIEGIELSLTYDLGYALSGDWSLYGNYTYLEGELTSVIDSTAAIAVTEPYSRLMPATFHGGISWDASDYWARLTLTHADKADKLSAGDKQDTQRIPPSGTPAYTVVNLETGWQLSEQVQLTAAVRNLSDEAWRSHGSGSNEPGRGLDLGLRVEW